MRRIFPLLPLLAMPACSEPNLLDSRTASVEAVGIPPSPPPPPIA